MRSVIIAGGKGTRLKHLTKGVPKPMIQIAGKPVMEHQIELMKRYGIKDIYILTGHLGHAIEEYFKDGEALGVNIGYQREEKPLGTSGCVRALKNVLRDDFLVVYGDLMLDMKLDDFIAYHKRKESDATLVVHPNDHPYDSDLLAMDNGNRITDILTKEQKPKYYNNLVNAAVYMLSPVVFDFIPENRPSDFVRDVFPTMLRQSLRLHGYNTAEYIKDMGTVDRFEAVTDDYLRGKIHRLSKESRRPAIFLDRDGTLVKNVPLLNDIDDMKLYSFSCSALKKINRSDYLSFLITNQPVVARNLCTVKDIEEMHKKLDTLLGSEHAYLNGLYYCPHHPDKGYPEENTDYKIDCTCRKPKMGMIESAIKDYNIDTESSWVVGDSTTDIQTGVNAGMQTVLVMTGNGGKDGKYDCAPDFVFDDLERAVDYITIKRHSYDPYNNEVLKTVSSHCKDSLFIVSVAGLARSGKSIFVKQLAQFLNSSGISTKTLSLDNWLLGVSERSGEMTVRDRFRCHEIARDVRDLLDNGKITCSWYDPYTRNTVGSRDFLLNGSRCLIIEGVPALDIEEIRNNADIRIYIEVDETVRKERFFSYYKWKDLPDDEIDSLYQRRLNDEVPYIKESRKYAHVVLKG